MQNPLSIVLRFRKSAFWILLAALVSTTGQSVSEDRLPSASQDVVLTISGAISKDHGAGYVELDMAGIDSLGVETIESANPWVEGINTYTGVPLQRVLDAVGADGTIIRATALNDYQSDIPVSDLRDHRVFLVSRLNGKKMSIRDKGPLWIIYAQDTDDDMPIELRQRMVWQLNRLEILD